ncbi:MAG TPA: Uma2 family endonuclease [Vicinamibacteria bacterium]|jgi:Uma2 family endonuclease
MASLVRTRATYEDLLRLAEEPIAEIVDGSLYTSPRPSIQSGVAAFALSAALGGSPHLRRRSPGSWWILFQPELQLADDILVADLAGWRRERLPRPPEAMAIDLAPDWVCEILSLETESFDRARKLPAYARHGIPYAWLVSPAARSLEALRLEGGCFTSLGTVTHDAVVRAEPFAFAELDLPFLWGE